MRSSTSTAPNSSILTVTKFLKNLGTLLHIFKKPEGAYSDIHLLASTKFPVPTINFSLRDKKLFPEKVIKQVR